MSLPNYIYSKYIEIILAHPCPVLRDWTFGRELSHEGGALRNEIKKQTPGHLEELGSIYYRWQCAT